VVQGSNHLGEGSHRFCYRAHAFIRLCHLVRDNYFHGAAHSQGPRTHSYFCATDTACSDANTAYIDPCSANSDSEATYAYPCAADGDPAAYIDSSTPRAGL